MWGGADNWDRTRKKRHHGITSLRRDDGPYKRNAKKKLEGLRPPCGTKAGLGEKKKKPYSYLIVLAGREEKREYPKSSPAH